MKILDSPTGLSLSYREAVGLSVVSRGRETTSDATIVDNGGTVTTSLVTTTWDVFGFVVTPPGASIAITPPDSGTTTITLEGDGVAFDASGTYTFEVRVNGRKFLPSITGEVDVVTETEVTYSAIVTALLERSGAEIVGMLGELPGGSLNMDLYSARDSVVPAYTRNANLWASPLVSQLTGAVAYKDDVTGSKQSYGGILISPRHILYCNHAHPHARNTWPPNMNSAKTCMLHFVLANGTVVLAEQIAQTTNRTSLGSPGAYTSAAWPAGATSSPDLCVAVLDRDVQALGVHVMPIPDITDGSLNLVSGLNVPTLNVTQGYERSTAVIPPTPISDYPQQNRAMLAVGRGWRSGTPYELFDYAVWDGDSGTPAMILLDGTLYLERIILFGGGGGQQVSKVLDHVNAMIQIADADAVTRGRMAEPTGIVISAVSVPLP